MLSTTTFVALGCVLVHAGIKRLCTRIHVSVIPILPQLLHHFVHANSNRYNENPIHPTLAIPIPQSRLRAF